MERKKKVGREGLRKMEKRDVYLFLPHPFKGFNVCSEELIVHW